MIAILKLLFGWLSGGVAASLADAYKAREQAQTDGERIAADERVSKLHEIADVQKAEAGSRINAAMRFLIALGPAVYLIKIFVWDKVLGWGATDDLSANLWSITTAVVGFYFLHDTVLGATRVIARRK